MLTDKHKHKMYKICKITFDARKQVPYERLSSNCEDRQPNFT
jgi:hypothetical protein